MTVSTVTEVKMSVTVSIALEPEAVGFSAPTTGDMMVITSVTVSTSVIVFAGRGVAVLEPANSCLEVRIRSRRYPG